MARDDGGDKYGPGAVIKDAIQAKALAEKHWVPIRNLKKAAPFRRRREMDDAACRADYDLPLPGLSDLPQAAEGMSRYGGGSLTTNRMEETDPTPRG